MDHFFEPGGWSQCLENMFAIEANIPQNLGLYISSVHNELYNWVNCRIGRSRLCFALSRAGNKWSMMGFT